METKIEIYEILDINLNGKSYIQLNTNKGTFLLNNKEEADNFLRKWK